MRFGASGPAEGLSLPQATPRFTSARLVASSIAISSKAVSGQCTLTPTPTPLWRRTPDTTYMTSRPRLMATTGSLPDDSDVRDINVVGFYDDSAYYAVAYVESLEIGGRPYLARQVHSAIAGRVLSAYRLGFGVYGGDLSLPGPRLRRRNLEARRRWVDPATSSKHQPKA